MARGKLIVTFFLLLAFTGIARQAAGAVIISQYYEGSSFNKWIELTNTGGASVDLDGWTLALYSNANRENWKTDGATSATLTFGSGDSIAAGASYLLSHTSASAPSYATADTQNGGVINFNGDDSIVLYNGTASFANVVDAFGVTGSGFADTSYVRKSSVTSGTNSDFDASQWDEFSNSAVDSASVGSPERLVGLPAAPPPARPTQSGDSLIISEVVDATLPGGQPKYVELTNVGGAPVDLSQYSIGNFNNGSDSLGGGAASLLPSVLLQPGESFYIAYEFDPAPPDTSEFEGLFGFAPDMFIGPFTNGDDVIALFLGAATDDGFDALLVDLYGVIGVDGTGEIWDYTDGFSQRLSSVTGSNPNFDSAEWFFGGVNALEGADDAESRQLILGNVSAGASSTNNPVPEPGSAALALLGLIGMVSATRRRRAA